MKIAIIIEDINKSAGQERVIAELVTRLVERHEIHVYCYEARDIPDEVHVHRFRRTSSFLCFRGVVDGSALVAGHISR